MFFQAFVPVLAKAEAGAEKTQGDSQAIFCRTFSIPEWCAASSALVCLL